MLMFALMKEKSVSFVTFVGVSFRGAHAPLFLGGAYLTVLLLFTIASLLRVWQGDSATAEVF